MLKPSTPGLSSCLMLKKHGFSSGTSPSLAVEFHDPWWSTWVYHQHQPEDSPAEIDWTNVKMGHFPGVNSADSEGLQSSIDPFSYQELLRESGQPVICWGWKRMSVQRNWQEIMMIVADRSRTPIFVGRRTCFFCGWRIFVVCRVNHTYLFWWCTVSKPQFVRSILVPRMFEEMGHLQNQLPHRRAQLLDTDERLVVLGCKNWFWEIGSPPKICKLLERTTWQQAAPCRRSSRPGHQNLAPNFQRKFARIPPRELPGSGFEWRLKQIELLSSAGFLVHWENSNWFLLAWDFFFFFLINFSPRAKKRSWFLHVFTKWIQVGQNKLL